MLAFDDIKPGSRLRGLAGTGVAEVVLLARFGADALNLVFRANGRVGERLLYRGEETSLELVEAGHVYGFNVDGGLVRLASEAYRIRLAHLFDYWDARAARLREEERAGKEHRINAVNAEATAQRLLERLHKRQQELDRERQIGALPPVLKGAALVVPAGLLAARSAPETPSSVPGFAEDAATRAAVERLAMEAVMVAERRMGSVPRDVSAESKGWDIESRDPRSGHLCFVEVKGRHAEARDVILTKNEILASLNAPDAYFLALVRVEDGFAHAPVYVQRFFQRELGFAETAIVFNLAELLSLADRGAGR